MLISGFGRRGKAKGDIPGVRFKVVKVSGVGLLALWKEKKVRPSFLLLCINLLIFDFFLASGKATIINRIFISLVPL